MNDWLPLIPGIAQKYQVDPLLIRAIVMVESGGNTWAYRYENNWKYFEQTIFYAKQLGLSHDSEKNAQACSWGLMQVMGSVCRELGWRDHLTKVLQPHIGLDLGTKKISKLLLQYKDVRDAIASYNAGSPVVDIKTGRYANYEYVGRVMSAFKSYKGE